MVGVFIGSYFWRRRAIKRTAETMSFAEYNGCCNTGSCCCCCVGPHGGQHAHKNLESAPIRAIWCWIVFCLNPHVLGMVFPFTGMTLVSAFCGIWILAWVGTNHKCIHFGSSKFTLQSIHITKALLGFALPQQAGIGIIGALATEYYLFEVQFWWGLSVLILLLAGGIFMCFMCLDMSWAAKYLNGPEHPQQDHALQTLNELVFAVENARVAEQQPQPVVQQHVVQIQAVPPPVPVVQVAEQVVLAPQAHLIAPQHQQGPVVPPPHGHVIVQQPQDHVVQPQLGAVVPPPQQRVLPVRPQSHVIDAQPIYYGNPSDAPPPPNGPGAFSVPSPVDVYQNPSSYMVVPNASQSAAGNNISEMSRLISKRAIKIAAIEVDPVREAHIFAKVQELLQAYNLVMILQGEDGNAASLRNDLAKSLAEELKMYRNDSIEDLAFGLKEAILLWKDENGL